TTKPNGLLWRDVLPDLAIPQRKPMTNLLGRCMEPTNNERVTVRWRPRCETPRVYPSVAAEPIWAKCGPHAVAPTCNALCGDRSRTSSRVEEIASDDQPISIAIVPIQCVEDH